MNEVKDQGEQLEIVQDRMHEVDEQGIVINDEVGSGQFTEQDKKDYEGKDRRSYRVYNTVNTRRCT